MTRKASKMDGTLTLIGSGEMSPSMGKVHRAVLSEIAGPVKAVFLDTPAGFELNADQISAKAISYFKRRLQTDLTVASFKSAAAATVHQIESILESLRVANYIFTGPGSPTYAVRNWRDTAVWETVIRRVNSGAHLVAASAAAIALGRYALPVYEIYKVGDEPHWVDGLDFLRLYGLDLAIVPHWNNNDGGAHDTRFCFMGEPRLKLLEQQLPDSTVILGIDEYTACILDLADGMGRVVGTGQVTIRRKGKETAFPSGTAFTLDQMTKTGSWVVQQVTVTGQGLSAQAQTEIEPTSRFAREEACLDVGDNSADPAAPFVELLVAVRARLRAEQQWDLSDEIRQRLSEMGFVLEDDSTGTTWRRE